MMEQDFERVLVAIADPATGLDKAVRRAAAPGHRKRGSRPDRPACQ